VAGEVVKAFVVAENPNLTADEIVKFCRQSLTNYKVPKLVEFRESLPKTPVGKILRRELRGSAGAGQGAPVQAKAAATSLSAAERCS